MDYTIEQYNALCAAIATGALTVKYGDKEVQYRSLADMLRTKDLMADALGLKPVSKKKIYSSFSKGLFPTDKI